MAARGPDRAACAGVLGTNAWTLVRPILDVASGLGLPRPRLLRELGLAAATEPAEVRIPIERVWALWAGVARQLGDPLLPLRIARATRLEDLQLMGFAILTAPTGHAALAQAIRYAPLITDSGRWSAEEDGDRITVRWVREGERRLGHRLANEAGLAQFVACMRQLCGDRFAPAGVRFRHAAPPAEAVVDGHRAFFRCPVAFGGADDAFWFERRALQIVPPAANPGLAAFVRDHAERSLGSLGGSLLARTRDAIDRALRAGERPGAEAAARELGMSERTLRRRLAVGGASFSTLVDEMLRERARTLVAATPRSITDIAIDLGFSDASAFSHAFRRWHGCAPRELRARRARSAADANFSAARGALRPAARSM
ncbi:MAG TPA: AraC family transcriptional regulator ligand-binding domain-containing protein [Kofleriaceae bacterium]|nr:AraC family transcriptional regulator ligand-binding domain-containing protein [Kofleriaceae bacterium]